MVRWMQRFFQYLDRFYVEINSLTPLALQGQKIFKTVIFQPLITNITQSILNAISRERNEELVDVDLLKKTIEIYLSLSNDKFQQDSLNCIKNLEDRIVEHTKNFYINQSQSMLSGASLSEYLHKAHQYLRDEQSRVDRYLTWDSIKDRLFKTFKEEMLYKHQASLLDRETGIRYLLQHEKTDDISLLFTLYQDKEEYLAPIALAFREHIHLKGQELVGRVDFN